jgi:ankyrin repeat protein
MAANLLMLYDLFLQVNIQNNRGQTALFHCVIRGDITACYKLLKKGANASLRGTVWETRKQKRSVL